MAKISKTVLYGTANKITRFTVGTNPRTPALYLKTGAHSKTNPPLQRQYFFLPMTLFVMGVGIE